MRHFGLYHRQIAKLTAPQTDEGRFSEYEELLKRLEEKFPDMKTYISDVKVKVGDRVAERATRAKFPFVDAVKAVVEKHGLTQVRRSLRSEKS